MPSIEEALRVSGKTITDLSGVLLADGPGSFTGLRIAFATVQGVASQRPDLAVMTAPSLLSAAFIASRFTSGPVAVLYDALRGEVFAAVYQFSQGRVTTLFPPTLTTVAALRESGIRPQLAVGDGVQPYAAELRDWTGRDPVPPPEGGPRAAGLIELLPVPGTLQPIENLSEFEPNYGRLAEAQVRWERQHGRPLPGTVGDRG
jgi:tRNA threonylcarbamoyladenosine biosynthesis protein TsaB